ncbi:MAG: MoaD/ThiS family protein [Anaeromyxobacter sp.]
MPDAPPITFFFHGSLRSHAGGEARLSLRAPSVRAALAELERTHPSLYACLCDETGALRRHLSVFVNSRHVADREGIETRLVPGDAVVVLPAVSGGRPCPTV